MSAAPDPPIPRPARDAGRRAAPPHRRRPRALLALALAAAALGAGGARAQGPHASTPTIPGPQMSTTNGEERAEARDGRHDFDFLHGTWRIRNRRLRRPLTGSTEWYEFPGRATERPLWDGQGNLEEYEATPPEGGTFRGLALRLYDSRARRWSIHWSDSGRGTLDAPMIGEFRDGRGEFYGHEDFDGRRIFSRFLWTPLGPNAARWEQAFSADAGASWETNWVMEFTRMGPAPSGGTQAELDETSGSGEAPASEPAVSAEATDASTSTSVAEADEACCPVLELRRYTLHPGKRDTLIELFEREFVEAQEEAGMRIVAQFRDLDEPDRFVWLRGFRDVGARAAALGAFYFGPTWQAHRDAANATLVDSDHVRLLRPAGPEWAFRLTGERPPRGATELPGGLVVATVYPLAADAVDGFAAHFAAVIAPRLAAAGATPFAAFETEASPNDFPRLPVREDERVFVWFARFDDDDAYERHRAALDADPAWTRDVLPGLQRRLAALPEVMRLTPTARSHPLR